MIIFAIIIFLLLSAFFSGSEIAFVSASKLGIELKREKGSRRGNIISKFYDNPEKFLGTMLIGNNIALVAFTIFLTKFLLSFMEPYTGEGIIFLMISTFIGTFIVLMFGEFLPKVLFRLYSHDVLYLLAYPLSFFKFLLALPTWFTNKFSTAILKYVLRAPIEKVNTNLNRTDLEHYIEDNINEDDDDIDKDLISNVLNLGELKVRDCMVPRTEIVYLDQTDRIADVINIIKESKHSRILVVDGDIENVLGYVHHQQLFSAPESISKMIYEIPFVPEAMGVRDLMSAFIKNKNNIACVVDEYGSLAGLITLEDILEEIFGEIEDEHDEEAHIEIQISETEFLLSGRLEIVYLNEKYEALNIPTGDYHTLSGYIIMTTGSIPEQGDQQEIGDYLFQLEKVSDTKIEIVRLIVLPKAKPAVEE